MRVTCDARASGGGDGCGGPVWRLTLDPGDDDRTGLDGEAVRSLSAALARADADEACRVLVLQGVSGRFCTGMDLGYVQGAPAGELHDLVHLYAGCLTRLRGGRQVVVAAVDGPALGGGLGLAAAADVLLATENASFGLPELVLGLLPAMVMPLLLERLPPQKARLLALGTSLPAQRALTLGLVDRLVSAETVDRSVRAAVKHALRCSPTAVRRLKRLGGVGAGAGLAEAILAGADETARYVVDAQVKADLRRIVDGEPMPWFARETRGAGEDDDDAEEGAR